MTRCRSYLLVTLAGACALLGGCAHEAPIASHTPAVQPPAPVAPFEGSLAESNTVTVANQTGDLVTVVLTSDSEDEAAPRYRRKVEIGPHDEVTFSAPDGRFKLMAKLPAGGSFRYESAEISLAGGQHVRYEIRPSVHPYARAGWRGRASSRVEFSPEMAHQGEKTC